MTIAYKTTKHHAAAMSLAYDKPIAVTSFGSSSTRFTHRTHRTHRTQFQP